MHVARGLHVAENVVLQVSDRFERIRHVLVLLDVPNDLCCFGTLGKIDLIVLLDDG